MLIIGTCNDLLLLVCVGSDYFILKQDNYAQETGNLTPSGGTADEAINGVRTKGFEVEMSGQMTPRWQIHAGINHNISRQQGNKVATLNPENQFTLSSTYKPHFVPGLSIGGGARWQDKTWDDVADQNGDTVKHTVDDYWLFDAAAGASVASPASRSWLPKLISRGRSDHSEQ